MIQFYDTHAHLDFPDFAGDLPGVIERALQSGISRIISIGTDLESSARAIALAERYDCVYATAGWHPTHVREAPEDIRAPLRELALHPKVVAIGETGLDYYRLPSQQSGGSADGDETYKRRQADLFGQQLEVAAALGLNVVVHQRGEVFEETLSIMAPYTGRVRGQFHCFGGDAAAMRRVVAAGSMVSFTGIVTFKNAQTVRETLAAVPAGQFMFETDAPYLAPVPHRGKRCEPAHVKEIAELAAQIRGCTLEALGDETRSAARRFFPKLN